MNLSNVAQGVTSVLDNNAENVQFQRKTILSFMRYLMSKGIVEPVTKELENIRDNIYPDDMKPDTTTIANLYTVLCEKEKYFLPLEVHYFLPALDPSDETKLTTRAALLDEFYKEKNIEEDLEISDEEGSKVDIAFEEWIKSNGYISIDEIVNDFLEKVEGAFSRVEI